uniref:Homing endonuclease LAGLIDADG domain-containing protein n=1 Tax=Candida labiduridarum TaxID=434042 RepID=S5TNY3_9ASCO|nr:hypothetical protein [Candida labiduridarum]AGS44495.1 hypothetical protein [Candida labiduridarum]
MNDYKGLLLVLDETYDFYNTWLAGYIDANGDFFFRIDSKNDIHTIYMGLIIFSNNDELLHQIKSFLGGYVDFNNNINKYYYKSYHDEYLNIIHIYDNINFISEKKRRELIYMKAIHHTTKGRFDLHGLLFLKISRFVNKINKYK